MKIITTSGTKALNIIPRQFHSGSVSLKLTNESTGAVVITAASASTVGNYMSFNAVFGTLKEGEFYTLVVSLGSSANDIIYKDKLFCTDQTIDQANNNYYSVNSGEYTTENSFDNDYIIL